MPERDASGGAFERRRHSRSEEQAVGRRRGRRDRPAEEGRHHLQGAVPVPRREDAVVRRHPGPRVVALLRLRPWRRHLQLRHAARRRPVPGGAAIAGIPRRGRDRRAHQARGRPQGAAPPGPRPRDRLLSRGPDRLEGRRAGTRVPARSRLHRRDHRDVPARLGAGRLGHDDPDALDQARRPSRGARRGRPRVAADGWPCRRLRQVPGARPVPDPRPERPCRRPRWPAARGRGPEVPELPGDAALRQEPDALPHRPGQGTDPTLEAGRDRRGLHRCTDGPPGRLRQRRRLARDGAHAGTGGPADPLRGADRPRLRRRSGGGEGGYGRRDRAGRSHRATPGGRFRRQARGRPRGAPARRARTPTRSSASRPRSGRPPSRTPSP